MLLILQTEELHCVEIDDFSCYCILKSSLEKVNIFESFNSLVFLQR